MRGWAQAVLDRVKSFRKRQPPGLCLAGASLTNSADFLSPASKHLMKRAEHELCDMGTAVRAQGFRTKKAADGPKPRKRVPSGPCNWDGCAAAGPKKPKTPQTYCPSCRDGAGAFYHLPCFFKCHRCYFAG